MLKQFVLSAATLLTALTTPGAAAFCTTPAPAWAYITVSPWVPTPLQSPILTVVDYPDGGCYPPPGSILSAQVDRAGGTITIHASMGYLPGLSNQLDLGTLPVGRYTVRYSSHYGSGSGNQASIEFSVSEQGYATALEYFNSSLEEFFVTSDEAEIQALDAGVVSGWSRTGQRFRVIPSNTRPSTAFPVCRFYGRPEAGIHSHFFTASPAECAEIQQRWPGAWLLETTEAFAVVAPETFFASTGCPAGSIAL